MNSECNKTMKSVGSRQNFSVYAESMSTCKSTCRRRQRTDFIPFNLSSSNRRKKQEVEDTSAERYNFKARRIPKSHKAPFMVYHSTKSLTSFKNVSY